MKIPYIKLHESGVLEERIEKATRLLNSCCLCPHRCKVNRLEDEKGKCGTGRTAFVASFSPHFGEESPLVGSHGSGTIFFEQCNLLCLFCQNYDISHSNEKDTNPVTKEQLAEIMVALQNRGCHNINFVTPSHVVPQILEALPIAISKGLRVPLVYNSGGYDAVSTLKLLHGIFDIYMPDFKFWSTTSAKRYTNAPDYREKAQKALKEMHRQVGDLVINQEGIAQQGLLIRHLVMPGCLDETKHILEFIANEISTNSYVNIMDQYHPCWNAVDEPPINRTLSPDEFNQALEHAQQAGLTRLDKKDFISLFRRLGVI